MITYKTLDKSKYELKDGPWMDEPDKAQWIAHGLDCLIVRGPAGALCGYVGVPKSHPYFEKDYNDVPTECAHGGLTFAAKCEPNANEAKHICHRHDIAANAEVFWFGFDCAHSGDLSPLYSPHWGENIYRNFDYVKNCVEGMAEEFAAAK